MKFKTETKFEDRKSESSKIMKKYPQRIPIIIEKSEKCIFNDIQKKKYLVPKDINMNNIIFIIRNKIQLLQKQGHEVRLAIEYLNNFDLNNQE